MNRRLVLAAYFTWAALVGTSTVSAAERTIEAKAPMKWEPSTLSATVGDVVEWKIASGTHGVRITNWAAVKDHVEVETVSGQQPFNAMTGQNSASTSTAGQVLLRLKIKSAPPAPAKITYDCIVHGTLMKGEVTVAAPVRTIEGKAPMVWAPKDTSATVGDVVEWKIASGTHGVRITNWAAVKDHVEVETVAGQQPFDATAGENSDSTDTAGQVLLRLKMKSVPPAPAEITFECTEHGNLMSGKVTVTAPVRTIEGKAPMVWQPKETSANVGDVVEWKIASGKHGVRITNWAAVKDHVEVETVSGQQPFDATTGENSASTSTAGQVLLRFKVKSVPPAPAAIEFECTQHGSIMNGKVSVK